MCAILDRVVMGVCNGLQPSFIGLQPSFIALVREAHRQREVRSYLLDAAHDSATLTTTRS